MMAMSVDSSINFAGCIHKIFSYEPVLLNKILDQICICVTKEEHFHTKDSYIRIVCSKKNKKLDYFDKLLKFSYNKHIKYI